MARTHVPENYATAGRRSGAPGTIAWSIVMFVAGAVALMLPMFAGLSIVAFVSVAIVVAGIAHLVHAFATRVLRTFSWHLLLGAAYAAVGVYLVLHPALGLASLTVLLAVLFLIEGGLLIGAYFAARNLPGSGWVLANGVLSGVIGITILSTWPVNYAWVIGALLGINLIFGGIRKLMHRPPWVAAPRT